LDRLPEETKGQIFICGIFAQYASSFVSHVMNEGVVAQNPFLSLKRISDHSNVRFTANPKLALRAQTLGLRPFRFTKNGYQKFFNVRSRDLGNSP
jgi:hypothetical protein